jgi:hypothetical protein
MWMLTCGTVPNCDSHTSSAALHVQVATALIRFSTVLGVDAGKRVAWETLAASLAEFAIEPYQGVPILAEVNT